MLQPRALCLLDIQTRREVEQELRQILSRLQLTTVMVSHQYIDALLFGHQIIVLDQGQEVSVVVDPRSITLHQSKPESSARNVFCGEILQIVPVSAAFSEAEKKMEGLMRVSMRIDPSLPPLTADITVSSSTQNDTNPAQVNRMNITQIEQGEIDALFLYVSAARDLALPYLILPDEINLGNPAMAPSYEGVQFTNDKGQTFHGEPISFSAAVLKNTSNPHAAYNFIGFLLSPTGQKLVQAAHFLPSPAQSAPTHILMH
jgi:hypothetical protein